MSPPPDPNAPELGEDALFKLGLQALLGEHVRVITQATVQPPAQFADAYVTTGTTDPEALWRELGWLGKMASEAALLEGFSDDLSLDEARDCLRKQLTLHHVLGLGAPPFADSPPHAGKLALPPLWMLCNRKPIKLLSEWRMVALDGWPGGFYTAGPGFRLFVVVLRELPHDRETLPLRLFGTDEMRLVVRRELDALADDDPMRRAVDRLLASWEAWVEGHPEASKRRRWLMDYMAEVERKFEMLREEGRRQVREQAQREREQAQREREQAQREREHEKRQAGEQAVTDLCEALDIALDEARRAHIASLDIAGLDALRVHLKAHRSWPG